MRFFIVLYCISISIVGFICIPTNTFSPSNTFPDNTPRSNKSLQIEPFPQLNKKIKEKINKAFQFPFHRPNTKKFIHFIKELNDPKGLEWFKKQLDAGLKIQNQLLLDIDKLDLGGICWLWLNPEIKEFEEAIQNWVNHNYQQIHKHFLILKKERSNDINFFKLSNVVAALVFLEKGAGNLVQDYLKKVIQSFLGNILESFAPKLKFIHRCLTIKEHSDETQEVTQITKDWLINNKEPIQKEIDKKNVEIALQSFSLTCDLGPQFHSLQSKAKEFLTFSVHQCPKLIQEVIFQKFFSFNKSFFKNCIQWMYEDLNSSSSSKGQWKGWIKNALKHYLEGAPEYPKGPSDSLLKRLRVAHYFIRHFSQDFSDLVREWLVNSVLIELKNVYLGERIYLDQFEVIQLFNQIFSKLNQDQVLIKEVIQWIERFFEKKNLASLSYIYDPVERLQLAVCCIRVGEPFSSIAKKWLSKTETRGVFVKAIEEKEKRDFIGRLGPEELTLLDLYAFE